MQYEMYEKGSYVVIKLKEVLHLTSNIDDLAPLVENLLNKKKKNLAIHFSSNSYLCSKTGAIIVRCWETIKDHNGNLALINVNRDILDFLAVIDLDSLIKRCITEEELL